MDQGLTSLREEPVKTSEDNPVLVSPQNKEAIKLANVRSEISLLIKKRDGLQEDIENLSKTSEKTQTQLNREVRPLRKQKRVLLKQVDELLRAVGIMKGTRKKMVSAFEKFGSERSDALWSISRAFSLDTQSEWGKLASESRKLDKLSDFLCEIADFYSEIIEIVEAEASQNQRRGADLQKREGDIIVVRKVVDKMQKEWKEKNLKANTRLSGVDKKYEKVVKDTKYIEEEADKERSRLETWARTITLREKKVVAKQKEFKGFKEELDRREEWIDDQEKTLSRTMLEVRKRESDIMNND